MEKSNGKIITVSFVLAAFLTSVILEVIENALAVNIGWVARWRTDAFVQHGLPVAVGILTFLCLQFNRKFVQWADDVVGEVRKVVWPSQKETTGMTVVCCVMLLVAGGWFGLFDYVSGSLIKMIVKM